MSPIPEIGSASLAVIPSFRNFQSNLDNGTGKAMAAAGVKGGEKFGDAAGRSAGSRFKAGMAKAAKVAAAGLAVAAAGAIKFAGDALEEARESQKVGALTEATIKSTGKAAKVTAEQVGDLAGAISAKSGIDDEAIQKGANLILTFKNIRNEAGKGNRIFDRTTQAVTDMAAAMAGGSGGDIDLKAASIQVGKALNDPVKGVTALSKVGVTFTNQQRAQIKALVEGGDANAAMALGLIDTTTTYTNLLKANGQDAKKVADILTQDLTPAQKKAFDMYAEGGHTLEAQKRVLKELKSEFGGAAAAQATEADKLSVAWGNFKEEIGTELIPVMDKLEKFLRKKGIPALQDFVGWVRDDMIPAAKDAADEIKPIVGQIKDVVKWIDKLPAPAKLAGLAAILGGVGYTKLRGGNTGSSGALGTIGKAVGLAKPVKTFETNPAALGKGGPGGIPVPTNPSSAPGKGGLAALLKGGVTPAAAAVLNKYLNDWFKSTFESKGPKVDPKKIVSNVKLGEKAPFSDAVGKWVPFMDTAGEAARKAVEKADDALADLVNGGNAKEAREQFRALKDEARDQGVKIDVLKAKFPEYAKAIDSIPEKHMTEFLLPNFLEQFNRIREYGSLLDGLDGRTIRTFFRAVALNKPGDVGEGTAGQPPNRSGSPDGDSSPRVAIHVDKVEAHDYNDFMAQLNNRTRGQALDGVR